MTSSPEHVYDLVREAIELAISCVDTGEVLIPFVMTEGDPGAIITILAASADESLAMAQGKLDDFDSRTSAFAFAYDGFIRMSGERTDAIYVEAALSGSERIFVFVQRYAPRKLDTPATKIGNWAHLQQNEPRLQPSAKLGVARPCSRTENSA